MGCVTILFNGSFPLKEFVNREYSAQNYGHTSAVEQAIEYMKLCVLPNAIKFDLKLYKMGIEPDRGFGVTIKEEILITGKDPNPPK